MQSHGEGEEDPVIGPAAPPNLAREEQILPILARGEQQVFALGQISGEVFVPRQICVEWVDQPSVDRIETGNQTMF